MKPRSLIRTIRILVKAAFILGLLAAIYLAGSFAISMVHAKDMSRYPTTATFLLPLPGMEWEFHQVQSGDRAVRWRIFHLWGEYQYLNMPRTLIASIYLRVGFMLFLILLGISQLAKIFKDLEKGKPFARANARRLRILAGAMLGISLGHFLWQLAEFFVFRPSFSIPGLTFPWRYLASQLQPGLLLGGLVVLGIAEVFRLGHALEEEQSLTV